MNYAYYTTSVSLIYRLPLASEKAPEYFGFTDTKWIETRSYPDRDAFKASAIRVTKDEARKLIVKFRGIWGSGEANLEALRKQIK